MNRIQKPSVELLMTNRKRVIEFFKKCTSDPIKQGYLTDVPGREHYILLSWLSEQCMGRHIIDVGTNFGGSAIAFSSCRWARVVTLDVKSLIPADVFIPGNVGMHFPDPGEKEFTPRLVLQILQSYIVTEGPLIVFLDTAHEGPFEMEVLEMLKDYEWKGLLVMDDIHLNQAMEDVWASIPDEMKEDWTDIGHWSGTGVVYFGH